MSLPPLDALGAGVGQPHRLDFQGEVHQKEINAQALQVSTGGLDRTREDRRSPDRRPISEGPGESAWQAQEGLVNAATERRERRQEGWKRFSGSPGRSGLDLLPSKGAVAIDQALPKAPTTFKALTPAQWVEGAARFEEWGRANVGRIGAHPGVDLPGGDTAPDTLAVGRNGQRRQRQRAFTLA